METFGHLIRAVSVRPLVSAGLEWQAALFCCFLRQSAFSWSVARLDLGAGGGGFEACATGSAFNRPVTGPPLQGTAVTHCWLSVLLVSLKTHTYRHYQMNLPSTTLWIYQRDN